MTFCRGGEGSPDQTKTLAATKRVLTHAMKETNANRQTDLLTSLIISIKQKMKREAN